MRRLLAALLAVAAIPAAAQSWPSKPVRLVLPFPAGGATDTATRLLAEQLSREYGQQFIADNRPGANGAIAAEHVARSAPDGATFFAATNSPLALNPFLMKRLSYDPVKDFAPVARMALVPYLVVLNPEVKAANMKELVALAKSQPGKLSYAAGAATGIVAGEALKRVAGIDLLQVPYKGNPPAMTDVMGGRVSLTFTDVVSGLSHIKSGKLRAIAVTTRARTPLMPELPTVEESGYAPYDLAGWGAVFAPAGTPPEIVARLSASIRAALARPEMRERFLALGLDPAPGSPEELGAFLRAELAKWEKLVKDAGIQPE
jgi:tripartite-type tricarboxylate transporter receptor subunit TctC